MKRLLTPLLFVILATMSVACSESSSIRKAIAEQLEMYPESRVQDIYKNFCQDYLGPGHMIAYREATEAYLLEEIQVCREEAARGEDVKPGPLFVPVGDRHNYIRIDLCAVTDSVLDAKALLEAFVLSANEGKKVSPEQWKKKWASVASVILQGFPCIPNCREDIAAIDSLISTGQYILHHSAAYNQAYHPHYRIVTRQIASRLPMKE